MGRYEDDDQRITDRLDRDIENEGLGRYTPLSRPRITLIPKAGGVLHPCPHDQVEYVGKAGKITHRACVRCGANLGAIGGSK